MAEIITTEKWEDECKLGQRAEEIDIRVENKEMRRIIADLKAVMKEKNLTSLSAPAIGYNKRIFCIKFDGDIKAYINPIIVQAKGLGLSKEICSSIPNKKYIIPRNNDIEVMFQKAMGEAERQQLVGMAAYVFQHEINHLDGLIISDVGLEIDEAYENASDEEKVEVINAYLESLDIKKDQMLKEVESDPELKKMEDGIKFMEGVAKGEIKLADRKTMEN